LCGVASKAELPQVLGSGVLVHVLPNLGALGLVEKDLGLGFGGGGEARHFEFSSEFVLVFDLVA